MRYCHPPSSAETQPSGQVEGILLYWGLRGHSARPLEYVLRLQVSHRNSGAAEKFKEQNNVMLAASRPGTLRGYRAAVPDGSGYVATGQAHGPLLQQPRGV